MSLTTIAPIDVGCSGLIRRFVAWVKSYSARQQAFADLAELDSRDLADLGISRYDFSAIATNQFTRGG